MKIKTKALSAALDKVIRLTGGRQFLPILQCVRLESDGKTLSIAASNLDCYAIAKCDCDGELAPTCVKGSLLASLVKCDREEITITFKDGKLAISVNGEAQLSVQDANEFPTFPSDPAKELGVAPDVMAEAIKAVSWAVSTEDLRQILKGVHVAMSKNSLKAEAADGWIVAQFQKPLICSDADFVMQSAAVGMVCDALLGDNSTLALSDKYLIAKSDGFSVASKLMEGQYPNTKGALDAKREPIGTVNCEQLLDAVGIASSLNTKQTGCDVRITPSKLGMKVELVGDDTNTYCARVASTSKGTPFQAGAEYVTKCFRSIKQDEVEISLSERLAVFLETENYKTCFVTQRQK